MTDANRDRPSGPDRLNALASARGAWLTATIGRLQRLPFVAGAYLVGSLAARVADAFSDIDLIVVVDDTAPTPMFTDPVEGLGLPGPVLYIRPKPRNFFRTIEDRRCISMGATAVPQDSWISNVLKRVEGAASGARRLLDVTAARPSPATHDGDAVVVGRSSTWQSAGRYQTVRRVGHLRWTGGTGCCPSAREAG